MKKPHGNTKHGMDGTRTYRIWHALKLRCDSSKSRSYVYYGGRGISYDPRWQKFAEFFADMGEAPEGMQIDRIDSDGDYCKENCRWATPKENCNNRRNNNVVLYKDQRITVANLARLVNLSENTLRARLLKGWPVDAAVIPPIDHKQKRFGHRTALAALIASGILLGCATAPRSTKVVTIAEAPPAPVRIPVPIPCVSLGELEPMPATAFAVGMTETQKTAAAAADLDALEAWAIRQEAKLRGCATEQKGKP